MTNEPMLIRAYIREGITRLPLDVQKFKIEKAANELGLEVRWYVGKDATKKKSKSTVHAERELWIKQLRKDEVGIISNLAVLRLTTKQLGGIDPKSDFAGMFATIEAAFLMEADTGLTSKDKVAWREAVTLVANNPPPGTNGISSERASEIATEGWKTRNRGVVATWKSEARETERKHLIRHWLASKTAKIAHSTLQEFANDMGNGVYDELIGISPKTLERIVETPRE